RLLAAGLAVGTALAGVLALAVLRTPAPVPPPPPAPLRTQPPRRPPPLTAQELVARAAARITPKSDERRDYDWQAVIDDCTEAIKLDPRYAEAWARRAFAKGNG